MGLIPGLGRSPRVGHGNPLQCFCLENPTDRGAWRAAVHRVVEGQTQLKYTGTLLKVPYQLLTKYGDKMKKLSQPIFKEVSLTCL